jgi:hypothetical protein
MSTIELGTEVGVQQRQPGYSKERVQAVMNRDKDDKMNGDVHVDETLIGGFFSSVGKGSTETKVKLMVAE